MEDTEKQKKHHKPPFKFSCHVRGKAGGHCDLEKIANIEKDDLGNWVKENVKKKCENSGDSLLHAAVRNRNITAVEIAVSSGVHVDEANALHQTSLHLAVDEKNVDVCRVLIAHHANVNEKSDDKGDTPVAIAARRGSLDLVRMLLEAGADVNAQNKKGATALHLATEGRHRDIVAYLMSNGAAWLPDKHRWFPIHYAAKKGDEESCKIIRRYSGFEWNKRITAVVNDKSTPLIMAAKGGHARFCQLLNGGGNIDAVDGCKATALHYAVKGKFYRTAEILVRDMGAACNIQDQNGNTSRHEAAARSTMDYLELLIEDERFPSSTNKKKQTVLHVACGKRSLACVQYLLSLQDFEKYINYKDINGNSALHYAVMNNSLSCVQALLKTKKCNIEDRNDVAETPFLISARKGRQPLCLALLFKGADLASCDDNGENSMHKAASGDHDHVITFLIKNQLPSHCTDKEGNTALHMAAKNDSVKCCETLLKHSKKLLWRRNNDGLFAHDVAFANIKDLAFQCLMKHLPYKEERKPQKMHDYLNEAIENKRKEAVKAVVESEWCRDALVEENKHCLNFEKLIINFPEYAELAMNHYVKRKIVQDEKEEVEYDFDVFQSRDGMQGGIHKEDKMDTENGSRLLLQHPLLTSIEYKRFGIIQHQLTEEWLEMVWEKHTKYITWTLLAIQLVTATVFSIYLYFVWNWQEIHDCFDITETKACSGALNFPDLDCKEDVANFKTAKYSKCNCIRNYGVLQEITAPFTVVFLSWMIVCLVLLHLVFEVNRAIKIKSSKIGLDILSRYFVVLGMVLSVIPFSSCDHEYHIKKTNQWLFGVVTILIAWFRVLHTLNRLPIFSLFMPFTNKFICSFAKFIFFILSFICVFAFVFHLLLSNIPAFSTVPQAVVKTVVLILGDLAYDDTFVNPDHKLLYPVMNNVIFIVLVTLIGGFIVNLVVSHPTDQLMVYRKNAAIHSKINRIQWTLELNQCFPWSEYPRKRDKPLKKEEATHKGLDKEEHEEDPITKLSNDNHMIREQIQKLNELINELPQILRSTE